jgi:hypothetical protein
LNPPEFHDTVGKVVETALFAGELNEIVPVGTVRMHRFLELLSVQSSSSLQALTNQVIDPVL